MSDWPPTPPDPSRHWRNRRRMAWLSLLAGLAFPALAIVQPAVSDIAGPFYLFVAAVVGAYIGFATWGDKR